MTRWLTKTIYQAIERLDKLEDAEALYYEVQRAFVHHLISKADFEKMTKQLDVVIMELSNA